MRIRIAVALSVLLTLGAYGQNSKDSDGRDETRDKLSALLETAGDLDDVQAEFHLSSKQPYNFVGTIDTGLKNAESLEIVLRVTANDTINLRVYPHYKGGYINLDKLKDPRGFMKKLLLYNDENFLFWGSDDTSDVFSGYTITLESGFPEEALTIVLRSIRATDRFVGELRPFIDGTSARK
jgi:hypothetical protein